LNFLRRFRIALRRDFSVVGRAAVIAIFAACIILTLWWVPKEQVASLRAAKLEPKEVFKAENDARSTLAQMFGGLAVLVGLYFAWKNITEAKEGHITDRFTKAIDQLGAIKEDGKLKLEVRLGGVYALERIARDSKKDHWPIMEILTAYVREHAPWDREDEGESPRAKPLAKDIQAILTVVGRRLRTYGKGEDQPLDLRKVQLVGANLDGANLEGANFQDTNLIDAHLNGANLDGAYLNGAVLEGAFLKRANLEDANLKGANLDSAYLVRANLQGAFLERADLREATLDGANLAKAINLTQRQVDLAHGDQDTNLPPGIIKPESWKTTTS
jgi:hypothetical protein